MVFDSTIRVLGAMGFATAALSVYLYVAIFAMDLMANVPLFGGAVVVSGVRRDVFFFVRSLVLGGHSDCMPCKVLPANLLLS